MSHVIKETYSIYLYNVQDTLVLLMMCREGALWPLERSEDGVGGGRQQHRPLPDDGWSPDGSQHECGHAQGQTPTHSHGLSRTSLAGVTW